MGWCKYCVDRSTFLTTYYKCTITGKEENLKDGYEWYCRNENRAYSQCPLVIQYGWFIVNAVSTILSINKEDSFYSSLMSLREIFDQNEEYDNFMNAYRTTGPVIARELMDSDDSYIRTMMIRPRLEKVAELVDSGKTDLASKRYVMLVLRLVSEYGLQDMYRKARDNGKKDNNKKVLKPLDYKKFMI